MRDTDLFQLPLGLQSPWTVTRIEFAVEDSRLDLYLVVREKGFLRSDGVGGDGGDGLSC
jgi:hypothetical protein